MGATEQTQGFIIVIDTREKKPYNFESLDFTVETIKQALPAGDYSLAGFTKQVAIERKTLQDFIQTVIHNKKRFRNELKLLQGYEDAIIVVEASFVDLLEARDNELTGASVASLVGSTLSIILDFKIDVFFTGDRQASIKFCYEYLRFFAKRHGVKL